MAKERLSDLAKDKDFGMGGSISFYQRFFDLPKKDRTPRNLLAIMAKHHACPNPLAVARAYAEDNRLRKGMKKAVQRYLHCNWVFNGPVLEAVSATNPELAAELKKPSKRLPGEPRGKHEKYSSPKSQKKEMSPLSDLVGFALPRVFIEAHGRNGNETPERFDRALEILEDAARISNNKVELLVNFAELTLREPSFVGLKAIDHLQHILEPGILEEQSCFTQARKIITYMESAGHLLWNGYIENNSSEGVPLITEDRINTFRHSISSRASVTFHNNKPELM